MFLVQLCVVERLLNAFLVLLLGGFVVLQLQFQWPQRLQV
jgi:hypothetical protein